MKICFLADINSYHTQNWCKYFVGNGYDVHVISISNGSFDGVKVHSLEFSESLSKKEKSFNKLSYLKRISNIKKIVNDIKPDILHAHYASSYGLFGALCNYKPYIISLWGSDILLFPKEGFIQKNIIKFNFKKANTILATSDYMKEEAKLYTNKEVYVTPFGIDTNVFFNRNIRNNQSLTIGIVKSLEKIYGINYLIEAVSNLIKKYPNMDINLKIVGEGTQKDELLKLVSNMNINNKVEFLGKLTSVEVADFYNKVDIAAFPSLSESFGVSVLEAQACGAAVVVSDIKAFYETTKVNESSLLCKVKDVESLEKSLEKLVLDSDLREAMGRVGSDFVRENFSKEDMFKKIESIYEKVLKKN
ncbi:MAG: glycosyltransferase [Clostridium sp.]|nr:glycosyltransferase [Clostridium sp.]